MIKGHYPIEIQRYLEQEIKEQAKPQPNLEIDNFLIKTFRRVDKLMEGFEEKHQTRLNDYKAKMEDLEALRIATEESRMKAANEQQQTDKPILNPAKVKRMGVFGAAMDLFFSKKK